MHLPMVPGMLTDRGRVLGTSEEQVLVWDPSDGEIRALPNAEPVADLGDRATYLLALEFLAERVGLDSDLGLLWYLGESDIEEKGVAWILEDNYEIRTRPADTNDPVESLRLALIETAPSKPASD